MRMPAVLFSLSLAATAAAQSADAAPVEHAALLHHYRAVETELRAAPLPLEPATALRRLQVIELLREYRERAVFGVDRSGSGARTPWFVDDDGRRCAVGHLLDRTGFGHLTHAIRREANHAWIAQLAGDAELQCWLAAHGLTVAEAARIQAPGRRPPDFEPPPPEPVERPDVPEFRPTDGSQPSQPGGAAPAADSRRQPTAGQGTAVQPRGGSARPRGVALDTLGAASWLDWWEWNRGAFELPQPAASAAPSTTTAVPSADHRAALDALRTLAASPHAGVRAAAVLALGRAGAPADALTPHLADAAREVRLLALLALGSGGTASHAYELAKWTETSPTGEGLAVALAGMALIGDGAAQRTLSGLVASRLGDARPAVQAAATLAAAAHGDARSRDAARAVVQTAPAPLQRANALAVLGDGAGDLDVAALTQLAGDRSVDVRRAASLALGRSKHVLALPALMTAFELEQELTTRALLLLAIGDHAGAAGRTFLLEQLREGSKPLRAHAALALGLWGRALAPAASAPAGEAITAAFAAERNRDQKGAYLLALGLLREPAAHALLATELRTGATSSTRCAAAIALGMLDDRAALPPLQQALTSDTCPAVRGEAATAMGQLGSDALAALAGVLRSDKDAQVQRAAALALGGIADPRAAAALLAFALDENEPPAARAGAALGLGRHFRRHEPALPELRLQRDHGVLPAIVAWAFRQEL